MFCVEELKDQWYDDLRIFLVKYRLDLQSSKLLNIYFNLKCSGI